MWQSILTTFWGLHQPRTWNTFVRAAPFYKPVFWPEWKRGREPSLRTLCFLLLDYGDNRIKFSTLPLWVPRTVKQTIPSSWRLLSSGLVFYHSNRKSTKTKTPQGRKTMGNYLGHKSSLKKKKGLNFILPFWWDPKKSKQNQTDKNHKGNWHMFWIIPLPPHLLFMVTLWPLGYSGGVEYSVGSI